MHKSLLIYNCNVDKLCLGERGMYHAEKNKVADSSTNNITYILKCKEAV